MAKLVIVESPTKARTIKNFLPRGYQVEASMGHIRDLPDGAKDVPPKYKGQDWARLGVNVDNDFEPLYVVPAEKKKVVRGTVNFEAQSSVRFLQVTVGVMTRELEIEALIKDNDPRVRNDMLMILSNQTYESVSTADGKEALRTRCLDAIRTIVREMGGKPEKVEALYFTSFVMQ